ncbi:MAG: helix-turn-helix transcriptional regulator [Thermosynechococcaceae cyanobacterium]
MANNQILEVIPGGDNVFEDLGFEAEEAASLQVRADLMLGLRQHIKDCGWNQEQAAEMFGVTLPCISNLVNGEISQFSVDKLINMLVRVGMDVKVEVVMKAA